MFPPQTSLIPATVALLRFFEEKGFSVFFQNYPYWYLGSTPFRYLIGPAIPFLEGLAHKFFPNASLFTITIYFVIFSFLAGSLGWGILAVKISKNKTLGIATSLLLLVFPWRYLVAIAIDEPTLIIAKNFLPFCLLGVLSLLEAKSFKNWLVGVGTTSTLLLINTSILPLFLVGAVALALAFAFQERKIRKISKYLKKVLLLTAFSLLLVTFWYSPDYWLTILTNPSIGGASALKVLLRILDLLKASIPLLLAILTVYFSGKIKDRFSVFILTWVLTFLFLTVFRFIGDPDFWMDWSSWFFELEIGLGLFVAKFVSDNLGFTIPRFFALILLVTFPFVAGFYLYKMIAKPALLAKAPPRALESLQVLSEIAKNSKVFLSGATVFWAGSIDSPPVQVRGGRDQVAVHPTWDRAAYELREGENPTSSQKWIEELDIKFVLVHQGGSLEYYHDFKNIDKWAGIGKVIWESRGDVIYGF